MKEPILVIMAAGMGSRYGGLKQIDPVDEFGNIIMDYSIFDAKRAGFKKVVFIIKKEIEEDFKEVIGNRISKVIDVAYAYQEICKVPANTNVPEGRVKPWGTGHAILCADDEIDAPFAVINADDCYGADAYKVLYDYLKQEPKNDFDYCMVGYVLENTLTDNGHVARGVCSVSEDGYLTKIDERLRIEKRPEGAAYTEDDGATWNVIPKGTPVSMNMWGFQLSLMKVLKDGFPSWLEENIPLNPMKCEYLLPRIIDDMLNKKECTVTVLHSNDKWYGVTYKQDKQMVVDALKALRDSGKYPQNLWEGTL